MTQPRYKASYPDAARSYAEQGATDREVAEMFGVSERTVHRWKHSHPEFAAALAVGKDVADQRVEQSLYRRATGYSHDAVKIFMPAGATEPVIVPYVEHVAPDTVAAIFWLKNRKPDQWRDKQEMRVTGDFSLAAEIEAARLRLARHEADMARNGGEYFPPEDSSSDEPALLEYQPMERAN